MLDVLIEFSSARPRISEFVAALDRMQQRLYSIASSQRRHPTRVHLTVGMLRYEHNDRAYRGAGSSFSGCTSRRTGTYQYSCSARMYSRCTPIPPPG